MNNILCCNAGRRGRLMIDMRKTIGDSGNVVATRGSKTKCESFNMNCAEN